ncbi:MAG: hypothetical protein K2P85_01720 [Flavobacteriaceae bacterium]|nr:hypothetical protein [Flavobacteriaceae bacterium]
MSLNENTGSIISLEVAKKLVKDFGNKFPGQIVSSFIGSKNVHAILAQENCIGVRIYNGYDVANEKISLVLVGVDKNEQDILESGLIYDQMLTCPPVCPVNGLLTN